MLPVLYSFRRCPYAMRARLALAESGQRCELREVVLRDKPAALISASPKGTVPVLVLPDGAVIDESVEIMLWALRRHDPHDWLAPESGGLDDMLALVEECDTGFKRDLDHYKYPERHGISDPAEPRARCARWLAQLDARLLRSSSRLFGRRTSLADAAIMPFVRQCAQVDRGWFDVQPWPALQAWLNDWMDSRLFEAIMVKHAPWEGTQGVPFP